MNKCFILGLTASLLSAETVLHPPSGLLYLACSTPAERRNWTPTLGVLEEDKVAFNDYIATYDPATGTVTRLTFSGFPSFQGYSSHGLDVVPSASDPGRLFIYAVNHRKPVKGPGKLVGADSVIEIFETTIGGNTLTHLRTIESPVINTPNDITGAPDGRSFYFTNDHGVKVGFVSRAYFGIVYFVFVTFADSLPRLGCSNSWGWHEPQWGTVMSTMGARLQFLACMATMVSHRLRTALSTLVIPSLVKSVSSRNKTTSPLY